MPIVLTCPNCDKSLKIPDNLAGKKIRCPSCNNVIVVPAEEDEETGIEASSARTR